MAVRIRRWRLAAGAVAALVLLAGTVVVWPGGPDERQPVLTPLRLAPSPLWTSEDLALDPRPTAADVVGGVMLLQQDGLRITAVDTATGKVRFTLGAGDDVTGRGGEWPGSAHRVPVTADGLVMNWHHRADCVSSEECPPSPTDREGLALVSAADGRTRWETTIIPSYPASDTNTRPEVRVDVVTDDVVLVGVGAGGLPLRTLAVDARSGRTLWEGQDPMWPRAVAGNTVLGAVPVPGGTQWTVAGADLRTGRRTWTRPGDLDESTVLRTAGDVTLLRGRTGTARERLVFVDGATGRTIIELDHPEDYMTAEMSAGPDAELETVTSCGDDGRTLIVCAGRYGTRVVALFRVHERTVTTVAVDHPELQVVDAWHGRAELRGGRVKGPADRAFTMDSEGNVVDEDLELPGRLEDLTADRATFVTHQATVEVYEVLR